MGWGGTGAYQYHSDVPKVRWDTDRDLTSESLYVHMMASARAPDGCVAFTNHLPSLVSSLFLRGISEIPMGWVTRDQSGVAESCLPHPLVLLQWGKRPHWGRKLTRPSPQVPLRFNGALKPDPRDQATGIQFLPVLPSQDFTQRQRKKPPVLEKRGSGPGIDSSSARQSRLQVSDVRLCSSKLI